MRHIHIVIPSYNEEESVVELNAGIQNMLTREQLTADIVFVDDGSTDKTYALLQKLHEQNTHIHAIRFRRNAGKAMALAAGFSRSQSDIIIMMDADLQDDPNDIPALLRKIDEGYDAVTGWKITRHDPLHKTIPSRCINFLVRKLFKLKLHDFNCGLKAFRTEVVKEVPLYGALYRYILLFAHANGYRVTEVATHHEKRKFGQSKYSISHRLRGIFDLITVVFLIKYLRRPLHFFGSAGFIVGFIGFCSLIYLAILHFLGYAIGQRPLLVFGTLCVIAGIQLFVFGLLGELLISQSKPTPPPIQEEF